MDEGADAVTNVIVHPMVLLHVLDHHSRRQESSGRVIGTLMGRRDGKTVRYSDGTQYETKTRLVGLQISLFSRLVACVASFLPCYYYG